MNANANVKCFLLIMAVVASFKQKQGTTTETCPWPNWENVLSTRIHKNKSINKTTENCGTEHSRSCQRWLYSLALNAKCSAAEKLGKLYSRATLKFPQTFKILIHRFCFMKQNIYSTYSPFKIFHFAEYLFPSLCWILIQRTTLCN